MSITGQPLPNATIRLRSATVSPLVPGQTSRNATSVSTDKDGRFAFIQVAPGKYYLWAERSGYISSSYGARNTTTGGRVFDVTSESHFAGLLFTLSPEGRIGSVVVNSDGEPVKTAMVRAMRVGYINGTRQLLPAGGVGVQGDGSYLIGDLAPGRYYFKVMPDPRVLVPIAMDSAGPDRASYLTTYYPNATDAAIAGFVELTAGGELTGVRIVVQRGPVFDVSGKAVDDIDGVPSERLLITLMRQTSGFDIDELMDQRRAVTDPKDGSFTFRQVPPGSYLIQPAWGTFSTGGVERDATRVGRAFIQVSDRNLKDIVLQVGRGASINGTIHMDESEQAQSSPAAASPIIVPVVDLRAIDGAPSSELNGKADAENRFTIKGVPPGRFRVGVSSLPDGTYVRSVRYGGTDITRDGFGVVRGANADLEIFLSPKAGEIAGAIRNSAGESLVDAVVSLWGASGSQPSDRARTTKTDQSGNFRFKNLPPAEYRVICWEDIDPGLAQNLAWCRQFGADTVSVSVDAGSHQTITVKAIPRAAIDAAMAKLP